MTAAQDEKDFIQVRELSKLFHSADSEEHILSDLNFTAQRGEIITVLGVSGTGKSTLLNMLGGIDRPTAGSVVIGGKDVTRLDDAGLTAFRRDTIGFVFQFYNLIPSLTAQENVLSALEAQRRLTRQDEAEAQQALNSVGLSAKADKFPEQLSGGEQQRVAIARAIIKHPPLILADEPTGNLDPQTGEQVMTVLVEHARRTAATLLIVSHNPAFCAISDRSLSLADGRLTPRDV